MATPMEEALNNYLLNPPSSLPGGFQVQVGSQPPPPTMPSLPKTVQQYSPPPSVAPAPGGSPPAGAGINWYIQQLYPGGIPAGTGTGERANALQAVWATLPPELQKEFLSRFPNFTAPVAGGGSGGGGGGFGGGGGSINTNARYALQNVPVNLPPELLAGLEETLGLLLQGRGIPENLLSAAQNRITTASKVRERNRLMRRGEEYTSKGLFQSGLKERSLRGIETEESEALLNALLQLDLESFNKSLQSRGMGVEGTLGLGNLGQLARNAAINESLGLGQLEIQRMALELERAIEEAKLNLLIQSQSAGRGEEENPLGPGPSSLPGPTMPGLRYGPRISEPGFEGRNTSGLYELLGNESGGARFPGYYENPFQILY